MNEYNLRPGDKIVIALLKKSKKALAGMKSHPYKGAHGTRPSSIG